MSKDWPEPTDQEREMAVWWKQFLRDFKKQKLSWEGVPEPIQRSALALHQNAQSVFWYDRLVAKGVITRPGQTPDQPAKESRS